MSSNRLPVRCAATLAVVAASFGAVTLAGPGRAARADAVTVARPRVLGGEAAAAGSFPHQAQLRVSMGDGTTGVCGASLIARRFLLTAAHCVTRSDGSPAPAATVTALLGRQDRSQFTDADRYAVDLVQRHEAFSPVSYVDDVAVLRLARPADVGQARLARPGDAATWAPGQRVTVIGWGKTSNDARDPGSRALLQVDLPVVADDACARAYAPDYLAAAELCAGGEPARDACSGDSGGPLLSSSPIALLVGLVSFGPELCGSPGVPASYARVGADPLNAWVRDRVPQAELDFAPAVPQPGQEITLTASARNPVGAYTALAWDLDGDGAFDDASGPSARTALPEGRHVVGLQASDGAGDREQRRVVVDVPRSPVAFTTDAVRVREGDAAVLTVGKAGGATGTLQPTTTGRTAVSQLDFAGPVSAIAFAPQDVARTISLPTIQDRLDERDESFTVALGDASSGLAPGSPSTVTVTIVDDDPAPKPSLGHVRVGRRSLAAPVSVIQGGRLSLRLTDRSSGRLLGSAHRTAGRSGRLTLHTPYTRTGRRLLRRGHRSVRLALAFTTPVGGRAARVTKTLRVPGR